jgi:hypothetical protein
MASKFIKIEDLKFSLQIIKNELIEYGVIPFLVKDEDNKIFVKDLSPEGEWVEIRRSVKVSSAGVEETPMVINKRYQEESWLTVWEDGYY